MISIFGSWVGRRRQQTKVRPRAKRVCLEVTLLEDRLVPALPSFTVVDIIPNSQSNETVQNAGPNIAVNPANASQAAIGVFGSPTNPYFSTQDGGSTWSNFQSLTHSNESVAWTASGNLYSSLQDNSGANTIDVFQSPPPNTPPSLININSASFTAAPQQPWVEAATVAGQDNIYVGFNNLSNPAPNTASLRYSTDGGATWRTVTIEHNGTVAVGQDGPDVREAINGNTVYAVFQRWTAALSGNNFRSNLVIVKDTNAGNGLTPFTALGANGVVVASNIIDPAGTSLGSNRTSSDISIAVDPNNANRVAVAYVNQLVPGGPTHVEVRLSTDGGLTWGSGPVFTTSSDSGLPAIAIAGNSTIGLLYAADVGGQIQMHFVQSVDNFRSKIDQTIFAWKDGSPAPTSQPYIGDSFDLNAVGNSFYGTFSATNDLTTAVLPFGVTLQRNFVGTPGTASFALRDTTGANPVAFSIDPYFFSVAAVSATPVKVYYPLRYSFVGGRVQGNLTLINQGNVSATGPFFVLFPQLPPGVTLANASGSDKGIPYITLNTTLVPKQPVRVFVSFNDPLRVPLSTFLHGYPVVVAIQLP